MHIYKLLSDELELKTKPKEVLAVRPENYPERSNSSGNTYQHLRTVGSWEDLNKY
jgi:hypothetical protein